MGLSDSIAKGDEEDVFKPICKDIYEETKVEHSSEVDFSFHIENDISDISDLENYGILPVEVIHIIFLFLSPENHLRSSLSSKLFFRIANTRMFWKTYYSNFFSSRKNFIFFSLPDLSKGVRDNEEEKNSSKINWKEIFFTRYVLTNKEFIKKHFVDRYNIEDTIPRKIILYGSPDTGKSCIIKRISVDEFQEEKIQETEHYSSFSLGLKFGTQSFDIWKNQRPRRYVSLPPLYLFRGASFVLLVFDLNNRSSFEELIDPEGKYHKEMNREMMGWDQKDKVILIGSKSDLERNVSFEEASEFAKEKGYFGYVETSSKNSENIWMVFRVIAYLLINEDRIV